MRRGARTTSRIASGAALVAALMAEACGESSDAIRQHDATGVDAAPDARSNADGAPMPGPALEASSDAPSDASGTAMPDARGSLDGSCEPPAMGMECEAAVVPVSLSPMAPADGGWECDFSIPNPPVGIEFRSDLVNVTATTCTPNGNALLPHVASSEECPVNSLAWYYDDPELPTRFFFCPSTCAWLEDNRVENVAVSFGCPTYRQP